MTTAHESSGRGFLNSTAAGFRSGTVLRYIAGLFVSLETIDCSRVPECTNDDGNGRVTATIVMHFAHRSPHCVFVNCREKKTFLLGFTPSCLVWLGMITCRVVSGRAERSGKPVVYPITSHPSLRRGILFAKLGPTAAMFVCRSGGVYRPGKSCWTWKRIDIPVELYMLQAVRTEVENTVGAGGIHCDTVLFGERSLRYPLTN